MYHSRDLWKPFPLDCGMVVMGILPFYHVAGLLVVLLVELSMGSQLVLLKQFEPLRFLESIPKYKVIH